MLVQAGLAAGQQEQRVDKLLLFGARCQDPFMGSAERLEAGIGIGQGDLADDTLAGQRGAQLMGRVGDELALGVERYL